MAWDYAYTPYIWPSVFTVLLLLILAAYSLRRRKVIGAQPFTFALLFGMLWATGSALEYAAVDLAVKITWIKFQTAWQLPAATAATCFVLEYTWPGRWLTRRNLVLLSIVPVLLILAILANDLHPLIWRSFSISNGSVTPQLAFLGWVAILYSFGIVFLTLIVFGWLFLHSRQHRWPVVIMVAGHLGLRTIYVLERADLLRSSLPLDVLGLGFMSLMYAVVLFGFRLFDPVALAHQSAIEQLHDGILVLDTQGRVTSLNPAAERILAVTLKQAKGKPVRDFLPAYPGEQIADSGRTEIEISLENGGVVNHYSLVISLLNDWRGLEVGRLLLLHDLTEQMRAQAQLMDQQRVLATVSERERLARELHDSLGQTLAAAHLQSSTARLFLAQGKTAETDMCLEQVAEMTVAAEADVREYLLSAKTAFSADLPFLTALRQYTQRVSQQYGFQVELSIPAQLEAQGFDPIVEVQLLRIIQEALSNVRKHACAKNANVVFSVSDSQLQVAIDDDGQGFDLAAVVGRQAEGFGLQAMRERAEALGGSLEVTSQPGKGTRVLVGVPAKSDTEMI